MSVADHGECWWCPFGVVWGGGSEGNGIRVLKLSEERIFLVFVVPVDSVFFYVGCMWGLSGRSLNVVRV